MAYQLSGQQISVAKGQLPVTSGRNLPQQKDNKGKMAKVAVTTKKKVGKPATANPFATGERRARPKR